MSSAKVKYVWSCTSTLPYVFMTWYIIKHRNEFNFFAFIFHTITELSAPWSTQYFIKTRKKYYYHNQMK